MNKVVVHFMDGRILKGVTNDFLPTKGEFHLMASPAGHDEKPVQVRVADMKALFYVKDFKGNPQHQDSHEFPAGRSAPGRKIRVVFKDGEVLVGTTQGYDRNRPGFFVVPADSGSNNERVFVVSAATKEVGFL